MNFWRLAYTHQHSEEKVAAGCSVHSEQVTKSYTLGL